MTTPHDPAPAHPTTTLLPWYLTGTLKEAERQAVDDHLAICADHGATLCTQDKKLGRAAAELGLGIRLL